MTGRLKVGFNKACPYCGSVNLKLEKKSNKLMWYGRQVTYSVRCCKCHSRGPSAGGVIMEQGCRTAEEVNYVTSAQLEKLAIERWNGRV